MEKSETLYIEIIRSLIQALKHLKDDGRLEENYEDSIDYKDPRTRDELGRTQEAARISTLETIMQKYEIKFGTEIQVLQDKIKQLSKELETARIHINSVNTRVEDLQKKEFEADLKVSKEKLAKIDNRGKNQTGKKRGPYKKRLKRSVAKAHIKDEPQNELGVKTINKYLKKIDSVLNNTTHFTKKELIAEVRDKIPGDQLAKLSGKETLKAVVQARWRLDGRRRRDLKLGVYSKKGYWKKKGKVYVSDK